MCFIRIVSQRQQASTYHLFVLDIGSWHSLADARGQARGWCLVVDSLIIRDALRSWSGAQLSPRILVKDPEQAFLSTTHTFKGHCKRTAMKLDSLLSSNRKFPFRIVYKAFWEDAGFSWNIWKHRKKVPGICVVSMKGFCLSYIMPYLGYVTNTI